ncbi:MAG: hotdog domain-containing protein [Acidimicrobiia bacterium]|nr:hotdog domain-containing protein [Acidimicrobiia bacterium]
MDGSAAEVSLVVGDGDTAIAHGSGDVPVLSTPRVLALSEQAAVAAIADHLPPGRTSVGTHAVLHHVKATQVGGVVRARAVVSNSSGRTVSFEFTVKEGDETVAYGTHRRVVVDRERFGG